MSFWKMLWRHFLRAKYHDLTGDRSCLIQDAMTRRK